MLRFKLRPYIRITVVETKKPTTADRFALVMARLKLEYDLTPDVLAAAEDVLQVLKARESRALRPAGIMKMTPFWSPLLTWKTMRPKPRRYAGGATLAFNDRFWNARRRKAERPEG